MNAEFFMLVGIPGSGKSTVAQSLIEELNKKHFEHNDGKTAVWISSDNIRAELFGSASVQDNPDKVFEIMRQRTVEALKKGNDAIYDACNISSKRRTSFLNMLNAKGCRKICIICATPYAECLRRNSRRPAPVPEYAINRMYQNWNTPYYHEGWDEIRLHYAEGMEKSFGNPEDFVHSLDGYDQETPFHSETLGVHMADAYKAIVAKGYPEDSNMAVAALLHDCGKPSTKVFNADSPHPDVAHYYRHEGTGAYDSMFFDYGTKTEQDVLEISALINRHMEPFGWKKEETISKREKVLGTELVEKILILHEADKSASQPLQIISR